MGLFDFVSDVAKVVENVAEVAITPVKVAASVAEAVTRPIAEAAKEVADDVRNELKGGR